MPAHGRALQLVLVSDDTRLMWKNSCCLNVLGAHSLLSPALFMWLQMSLLLWFKPPSIKVMLRWSLGLSEVFKIPSFIFNILTHIICKSFHDCNIRGHSGLNSVCNISLLMCQAVLFSDESCSAMSSVCEGEVIICNIFSADWCDLAAGLFPAESSYWNHFFMTTKCVKCDIIPSVFKSQSRDSLADFPVEFKTLHCHIF